MNVFRFKKGDIVIVNNKEYKVIGCSLKGDKPTYKLRQLGKKESIWFGVPEQWLERRKDELSKT